MGTKGLDPLDDFPLEPLLRRQLMEFDRYIQHDHQAAANVAIFYGKALNIDPGQKR